MNEETIEARAQTIRRLWHETDFADKASIERYAFNLEGLTFRDVLNLGILPPKAQAKKDLSKNKLYARVAYKGGLGILIEECYFGYDANSENQPDFPEAGVELKTTCYNVKQNGEVSAGERLSVTMVPYNHDLEPDFSNSHVWAKSHRILLIYYHRDKSIDKYAQKIKYVMLFTPPERDFKIIANDYKTIVSYVREGRADELSESLTMYLGAATKGATEASMWVKQQYPRIMVDGTMEYRKAKKRVFAFKRQYMDYVLHKYVIPAHKLRLANVSKPASAEYDSDASRDNLLIKRPLQRGETFEDRIQELVERSVGKTDRELCMFYGLEYTRNKSQWVTLTRRILGVTGNQVEEFSKANISSRSIRLEGNGCVRESLSFAPFEFEEILGEQQWHESKLYRYLEETRFFFVVFKRRSGEYCLEGAKLWNMPETVIESAAKTCWKHTRAVLAEGVQILPKTLKNGAVRYKNNLPKESDNAVVHVRPHAAKRAYRLEDGITIGDICRDASSLPDGRYMTKQSFWLNKRYLKNQLC